ncbi:hypothetical protein BD779DRAFT_1557588, partial [Infundibulicybe gibba]
ARSQYGLTVGLNYHIDKAQLVFPPKQGQPTNGTFNLGDTPVASPAVKATGSVEAHLIPSLNLGVSALGGIVNAGVFVALDASATMQLSLEAQAEAGVTINEASKRAVKATPPLTTTKSVVTSKTTVASSKSSSAAASTSAGSVVQGSSSQSQAASTSTGSAVASSNSSAAAASSSTLARSSSATASTAISTGITATPSADQGGLNINAGADASFFGLFDPSTQVTLFSKNFELFKKCFGTPSRKRSLPRLTRIERLSVVGRASGFACPSKGVGAPVAVTDQTVKAAGLWSLGLPLYNTFL